MPGAEIESGATTDELRGDSEISAPQLKREQLERVLAVGRSLVTDLDLESVLRSVLDAARELTGARYAALGILDERKEGLERFLFIGLDEDARRRIGPLPKGLGVLGELIRNPKPLRLSNVADHPRSYGFPPNHPPMSSFVGAPVIIRGEAFGNIYLTEKASGEDFDDRDEQMVVVLADWAAVAIENARLYEQARRREHELERAVQGLEATASLSRVTAAEAGSAQLLELIAKRGRALVESRAFLILIPREHGGLAVARAAGELAAEVNGVELGQAEEQLIEQTLAGELVVRLEQPDQALIEVLGLERASTLLAVLDNRGRREGFVLACDPLDRDSYGVEDELLLNSYATSAAMAIATAHEVERDRLRLSVESSERERRRWAQELHDETLQQLGAMKLMQENALRRNDDLVMRHTLERGISQFEETIEALERLITELRPAALDELGAEAAIESLVDKVTSSTELAVKVEVDLAFEGNGEESRHTPELEATIYRITQEAINNVVKHAGATTASISVVESGDVIELSVVDDGAGFTAGGGDSRFGLLGMRERVALVGGELEVESTPGKGTKVHATLPVARREPQLP